MLLRRLKLLGQDDFLHATDTARQITAHDFPLGCLLVECGRKPTVEVEQLPGYKPRITRE